MTPSSSTGETTTREEGQFTKDGGGFDEFKDRVESQKQIKLYLHDIFAAAGSSDHLTFQ